MLRLSFGKVEASGRGQAFDDFALLIVELGPGFQSSFFASRAGGIK